VLFLSVILSWVDLPKTFPNFEEPPRHNKARFIIHWISELCSLSLVLGRCLSLEINYVFLVLALVLRIKSVLISPLPPKAEYQKTEKQNKVSSTYLLQDCVTFLFTKSFPSV